MLSRPRLWMVEAQIYQPAARHLVSNPVSWCGEQAKATGPSQQYRAVFLNSRRPWLPYRQLKILVMVIHFLTISHHWSDRKQITLKRKNHYQPQSVMLLSKAQENCPNKHLGLLVDNLRYLFFVQGHVNLFKWRFINGLIPSRFNIVKEWSYISNLVYFQRFAYTFQNYYTPLLYLNVHPSVPTFTWIFSSCTRSCQQQIMFI